ncbi:MAG TPA: hypothetical protein VGD40_23265 [Chryseosolibacter sp.]
MTEFFGGEIPKQKSREGFYKISWVTSKTTREATLKDVIRVDSIKGTITHLQIRNDNKVDSSVASLSTLAPIFTSTKSKTSESTFIFGANRISYIIRNAGVAAETGEDKVSENYFDPFFGEYLIGHLPLKPGYKASLPFYTAKKGVTFWEILDVSLDALPSPDGKLTLLTMLKINVGGVSGTIWVDLSAREVIKVVYPIPDGVFIKHKI